MPQRPSGEGIAVEDTSTPVPRDQNKPTPATDLRAVPLARLAADADAQRIVADVLETMEGPTRVHVARFTSAI
jgi:hypothetical protein